MSTSRSLSLFVAVVLVVTGFFVIQAQFASSVAVSALDQHDRHPGFINVSLGTVEQARIDYRRGEWNAGIAASREALDQSDRHPVDLAALADQARLNYRRGEWNTGIATSREALDQSDRHPVGLAALADQARLSYRRGEWNAGSGMGIAAFDVEQARLQWRATQ